MTKNVHGVIQLLLTAIQGVSAITAFVPDKYKWMVATGLAALQGLIGILNHYDPTPLPGPIGPAQS